MNFHSLQLHRKILLDTGFPSHHSAKLTCPKHPITEEKNMPGQMFTHVANVKETANILPCTLQNTVAFQCATPVFTTAKII